MARRIRWLGLAMVLCFFVLLLQLNDVEVVEAHRYATDHAKSPSGGQPAAPGRDPERRRADPGPVGPVAQGQLLQVRTGLPRQWATLFSGVVGVDSIIYGTYGVEASYGSVLRPTAGRSRP